MSSPEENESSSTSASGDPGGLIRRQLSLGERITLDGLTALFDTAANDPGEHIEIDILIEGAARVYGLVQAIGRASFELYVSHELSHMWKVGWGANISVALGIDAGIASAEAGGGFGKGHGVYFASPRDAASWVLMSLLRAEEKYNCELDVDDSDRAACRQNADNWRFQALRTCRTVGASAGVSVSALAGKSKFLDNLSPDIEVSTQYRWDDTVVTRPSGEEMQVYHDVWVNEFSAELNIPLPNARTGKLERREVVFTYTREDETRKYSPIAHNGKFRFHRLSIKLPISTMARKLNQKQFNRSMQEVASGLRKILPGWKGFQDKALSKLYSKVANDKRLRFAVNTTVIFTWGEYRERDGSYSKLFDRLVLETSGNLRIGRKVGTRLRAEVDVSNRLAIHEQLHSETEIYIRLASIYRGPTRWRRFYSENKDTIHEFLRKCADPDFTYHVSEVQRILEDDPENITAALAAMRRHWDQEHEERQGLINELLIIGNAVAKGTNFWTWRDATVDQQMEEILDILKKYEHCKSERIGEIYSRFWSQGIKMKKFWSLAQETGKIHELRELIIKGLTSANIPYYEDQNRAERWQLSDNPVMIVSHRRLRRLRSQLVPMAPPEVQPMPQDGTYVAPRAFPIAVPAKPRPTPELRPAPNY